MALGRNLTPHDSERIRTILKDPTVTMVQFFPLADGFAQYGEMECFGSDGAATTFDATTPAFREVFAIMAEHDYPAEFNDKFFVQLTASPEGEGQAVFRALQSGIDQYYGR